MYLNEIKELIKDCDSVKELWEITESLDKKRLSISELADIATIIAEKYTEIVQGFLGC